MKENLEQDKKSKERLPVEVQLLAMRYADLDKKLSETAKYIKSGNVDPKELYK